MILVGRHGGGCEARRGRFHSSEREARERREGASEQRRARVGGCRSVRWAAMSRAREEQTQPHTKHQKEEAERDSWQQFQKKRNGSVLTHKHNNISNQINEQKQG